jgi:hypothetical protein
VLTLLVLSRRDSLSDPGTLGTPCAAINVFFAFPIVKGIDGNRHRKP